MKQLYTLMGIFMIAVLALGGIFTYVVAPILTVYEMTTAIEKRDAKRLAQNIDFPTLRTNLKQQFDSVGLAFAQRSFQTLVRDAASSTVASTFSDKMLEFMVTPSGLISLLEGQKKPTAQKDRHKSKQKPNFLGRARYSWDSLNEFSVWVPKERGKEIGLVLHRTTGDWKLSNIVLSKKV